MCSVLAKFNKLINAYENICYQNNYAAINGIYDEFYNVVFFMYKKKIKEID